MVAVRDSRPPPSQQDLVNEFLRVRMLTPEQRELFERCRSLFKPISELPVFLDFALNRAEGARVAWRKFFQGEMTHEPITRFHDGWRELKPRLMMMLGDNPDPKVEECLGGLMTVMYELNNGSPC